MRNAAIAVLRESASINGGSNVQFAVTPLMADPRNEKLRGEPRGPSSRRRSKGNQDFDRQGRPPKPRRRYTLRRKDNVVTGVTSGRSSRRSIRRHQERAVLSSRRFQGPSADDNLIEVGRPRRDVELAEACRRIGAKGRSARWRPASAAF